MLQTRQDERRSAGDRRANPSRVSTPEALVRLNDELRDPLSVIVGYADLLSEVTQSDNRSMYFTGKMRAAAMRLIRVADSISKDGGLIDQTVARDRRHTTRRAV